MKVGRLVISREIRRELAAFPHAARQLGELEDRVDRGEDLKSVRMKASGQSRSMVFQPYIDLRLHHAKLDFDSGRQGDPLLVFQETTPGEMTTIAVTLHRDFASPHPDKCWVWIAAHRDLLDFSLSQEAENVLIQLFVETPRP